MGAEKESLGIHAFTDHIGFDKYYSRDDFYADPRFGGKSEYDGTWGVWDEPFMQYFAAVLSDMEQPFVGTLFTLTSHHPFNIPKKYRSQITGDKAYPMTKAVEYTDLSLRHFFDTAKSQPWYDNTIFVVTADHSNPIKFRDEYMSEIGRFRIPILIFDPSGQLPRGELPGIAQQTDIMPTILNLLGNSGPYTAFGKDLFATPADSAWAFNWQRVPQYIQGDYVLQLDEQCNASALYNYKADPMLEHNLIGQGIPCQEPMQAKGRALIQRYLKRMSANNSSVKKDNPKP